jgi:hypothetical protein
VVLSAAVIACAAVTAIAGLAGVTGAVPRLYTYAVPLLAAGPAACLVLILAAGPSGLPLLERALMTSTAVSMAGLSARYAGGSISFAMAPAIVALTALAVARRPGPTITVVLLLTGTYGSVEIYTGLPVGSVVDLLLAASWAAAAWVWLFGSARPPRLNGGLWVLVGLVAVNGVYALAATNMAQGIYGFRVMSWYMLGGVLCALVLTTRRQQRIVVHGLILSAAVVGGYAVLRWVIGPGAEELAAAKRGGPYVLNADQEVRLFGSLLSPGLLGTWASIGVCAAAALAMYLQRAAWRLLAFAAAGLCLAAQFGAENRVPIVATAAGILAVLVLFGVSRGAKGRRIVPLAIGITLTLSAAGAFAAIELADDTSRFRGLLNIENDYSYQDRVNKWKSFLSDMPDHPLGHGLGSTGAAQVRYDRFQTIAAYAPDSAYVKVAYDQGYPVMILFIGTMVAMLLALAIRALGTADPWAAGRATAGFGALMAFVVMMTCGEVNEGLPGLAVWLLVGLGLAPVVTGDDEDRPLRPSDLRP